jgi:His-Xaa-Ser system protein HxsD
VSGEEESVIVLDLAVYSLEAIKNASYDFTDQADVMIEIVSPERVQVRLKSFQYANTANESLVSGFCRNVLDHQVRLDVAKDYKLIREMIVAQAFEPVDNLDQVMSSFKP